MDEIDKKHNIEIIQADFSAFLAVAFARSPKMTKKIDSIYYSDEKTCLEFLRNSKNRNSRIITDVKYELREKSLRALAVIEMMGKNVDLYLDIMESMKRSFKKIYEYASIDVRIKQNYVTMLTELFGILEDHTEIALYSNITVFMYFYKFLYGKYPAVEGTGDHKILNILRQASVDCLASYSEVIRNEVKNSPGAKEIVKDLLENPNIQELLKTKSLSSIVDVDSKLTKDLENYFQVVFRFTHFDNVPVTIYEDETFTRNELIDLINIVALTIRNKEIDIDVKTLNKNSDNMYKIHYMLVTGLLIRSFSRMHKRLVNRLTNTATSNRLSYNDNEQKLNIKLNTLNDKYQEQININNKKQEDLNILQIKYDKCQNTVHELNSKVEELEEKTRILEALLERKTNHEKDFKKEDVDISILQNKNIVVFGGPPNWHTNIKKVLPGITCMSVDNKNFNTSIIDNSDIIVIKTDYFSHAQWYRVIKQARNKNKKILYCQNNIDMLMNDLVNSISSI